MNKKLSLLIVFITVLSAIFLFVCKINNLLFFKRDEDLVADFIDSQDTSLYIDSYMGLAWKVCTYTVNDKPNTTYGIGYLIRENMSYSNTDRKTFIIFSSREIEVYDERWGPVYYTLTTQAVFDWQKFGSKDFLVRSFLSWNSTPIGAVEIRDITFSLGRVSKIGNSIITLNADSYFQELIEGNDSRLLVYAEADCIRLVKRTNLFLEQHSLPVLYQTRG